MAGYGRGAAEETTKGPSVPADVMQALVDTFLSGYHATHGDPAAAQATTTAETTSAPAPAGKGETAADKAAIGAGEAQSRIANLNAIAGPTWNYAKASKQEQAVAQQLAQQLFGTNDVSKLSQQQWTNLGSVAGERSQQLQTQQGTGDSAAAQEKAFAANPWNQMGQAIVGDLEAANKPVEAAMSGAMTAPETSAATNQALASIGLNPNSSAASWLNSEVSQANANDAPMAAAMKQYTGEYETGQQGIEAALGQMGGANALFTETAPYAGILSELGQHSQYYGIPKQVYSNLPPALQSYLSASWGGQGQGQNVVPTTPPTPGPTGAQGPTAAFSLPGGTGPGAGATGSPAFNPGNPVVPG